MFGYCSQKLSLSLCRVDCVKIAHFRRAQERERAEHSGDEEVGPVFSLVPLDLLACVRKRISCMRYVLESGSC